MKHFWIILLAFYSVATATTYYFDPQTGSDSANTGLSTASPWKTIPGSRNAADTADASTSWGPGPTFDATHLVPGGTTFSIKSGAIFDSNVCGKIYISKDSLSGPPYLGNAYYASTISTNNSLLIQRNTSWGSGPVIFNGANCTYSDTTGVGFFYINDLAGVNFDGAAGTSSIYDGFIIENTWDTAFFYYMHQPVQGGANDLGGSSLQFLLITNCGTRLSALNGSWESHGGIVFTMDTGDGLYRTWDGITINNVEIDNNGLYGVGLRFGEQPGRAINVFVHDVKIHDSGHADTNDSTKNGRGIVTKSCQIVISNAWTFNMEKGQDHSMPLQSTPTPSGWWGGITNINPLSYSNTLMGMGFNGPYGVWGSNTFTNVANMLVINGLIYDNTGPGVKAYSGPYNLWIINTTLAGNSDNLLANPSDYPDTNAIHVYLYNNCFCKPNPVDANLAQAYWESTNTTFVWTADYNSYVATNAANAASGTEFFSQWSAYAGSPPHTPINFLYGANGPGQSSGTWYSFQGWHNDAHSVGTLCTITTEPPFVNGGRNFSLTSSYPGTNLSSMPWYISQMSVDRNGVSRGTTPDMGAYQYFQPSSQTVLGWGKYGWMRVGN